MAAQVIVDKQGIGALEELCFLMDKDVEMLCCNIKHPGDAAAVAPGGAVPAANFSHMICQWFEKNIMLATYWLHYLEHISCTCNMGDFTVNKVCSIHAL